MEQFDMVEEYYCAAFHELAHATGHSSRLDRKEVTGCNPFGSEDYSKEELVAEMAAAYLCGVTGIEQGTIENSAAYIQGWLKQLKDDRKLVIHAAAAAQKAADFIRHIEQSQAAA
jgi:antirestriction protein ArdC